MMTAVWIGSLPEYMDNNFLKQACADLGVYEIVGVHIHSEVSPETGKTSRYGFLKFANEDLASRAFEFFNGWTIPRSSPPIPFKLWRDVKTKAGTRQLALWVHGLDRTTTDYDLNQFFATRFDSVCSAQVVKSENGQNYGFVRFESDEDFREALETLQGSKGFGSHIMHLSVAVTRDEGSNSVFPDALTGTNSGAKKSGSDDDGDQFSSLWDSIGSGTSGMEEDSSDVCETSDIGTSSAPYLPFCDHNRADLALVAPGLRGSRDPDFEDECCVLEYEGGLDVDHHNADLLSRIHRFWDTSGDSRWVTPDLCVFDGVQDQQITSSDKF